MILYITHEKRGGEKYLNFTQKFLGFSLSNLVVLYIISIFSGGYLVFGNILLEPTAALIVASLLSGFAVTWASEHISEKKYSTNQLMLIYWLVNAVTIYLLARTPISKIVAMGVKGFWVAIIVGFLINIAQYGVWLAISGKKK